MKKFPGLTTQKKQLRKILKEQRNSLDRESCASSDNAIFTNIRTWDIYQKAYTVFCFVGTEDEINTKPIIEDILKKGNGQVYQNVSAKGSWKYMRSIPWMTLLLENMAYWNQSIHVKKSHQKRLILLLSPACPAVVMDTVLDMAVGTMTGI